MAWIPIVLTILQYVSMLLQALANPQSVKMVVKTADGQISVVPCTVTKNGKKTSIKGTYQSSGQPIVSGVIMIGRREFARAKFQHGQHLVGAGPVELGDEF